MKTFLPEMKHTYMFLGGVDRNRTCYILLAKQALSRMSYNPMWYTGWDSNPQPIGYKPIALTIELPVFKKLGLSGLEPEPFSPVYTLSQNVLYVCAFCVAAHTSTVNRSIHLSYNPMFWWAVQDLNLQPRCYEHLALTC